VYSADHHYPHTQSSEERIRDAIEEGAQTALVQKEITKLSKLCFERCISSPSDSLSKSETSCLEYCVGRKFDSVYVMFKLT
jgi:hypothetical protein